MSDDDPLRIQTPSITADLPELDVEVQCPVCERKGKLTLKRPDNPEEDRFFKQKCPCGHAHLDAGWVFGDYWWSWSYYDSAQEIMYRKWRGWD